MSLHWWSRATLAAFVLAAWVTIGVAGGIAHADNPPPSDDNSTSEGSSDIQRPGAPGESTSGPSKPSGDLNSRQPRHLQTKLRDRTTNGLNKAETSTDPSPHGSTSDRKDPDGLPAGAEPHVSRTTTADEQATDDEQQPATKPGRSEPQERNGDRRLRLIDGSTRRATQIPADPQPPAADGTTNYLSALANTPQASAQASDAQPIAANVAPAQPAGPIRSTGLNAPDVPQLGRQGIGLVSDVGVVAASAVYTVANVFANAFGPNDFLGVPYALATALANTAAASSRALIGAPLDAASPGRFPVNYGLIDGLAFFNPQQPPPGANDPSITVTPEHPLPIILINGTIGTQGENWGVGAPVLANAGYKVYTFNYGNITQDPNNPIQATADIRQSGLELSAEVDRVLAETGAPKVILIGHSQGGGILPEYYINNLGGADKVSQVIGIAPSNHGTDFNGLTGLLDLPVLGPLLIAAADLVGPAFIQQTVGSPFQQEVYGNGDTRPGVLYTTIASTNDEVVTPYTQQALDGPNVTNIVIQDLYPGLPAGHEGMVLSPQVWSVVLDALASNPEANPLADPLDSAAVAA